MRLALWTIAVSLWIGSAAAGAGADGGWTSTKAASTVRSVAVVHLPPELATAMEGELEELVYRWRALEEAASEQDAESGTLGWMLGYVHNARYRLSTALEWVRGGLPIDEARCAGVGRRRAGGFVRFRCTALSAGLEIAAPEAVWENDRITAVRFDTPRPIGSFRATLSVTVTSRSAVTFRQLGASSPVYPG